MFDTIDHILGTLRQSRQRDICEGQYAESNKVYILRDHSLEQPYHDFQ